MTVLLIFFGSLVGLGVLIVGGFLFLSARRGRFDVDCVDEGELESADDWDPNWRQASYWSGNKCHVEPVSEKEKVDMADGYSLESTKFNTERGRWKKGRRILKGALAGYYEGVTCYTGPVGSGKTYAMIEDGLKLHRLHPDVPVITNAGFRVSYATHHFSSFRGFCALVNMFPHSIVLWDELPNYVNSRAWQDFPTQLGWALTQIRKSGIWMYYTAIDFLMVDKVVRHLTASEWMCHNRLRGMLLLRSKFPALEQRQVGEQPSSRKWSFVRESVAYSYDTLGRVRIDLDAVAEGKGMSGFDRVWESS